MQSAACPLGQCRTAAFEVSLNKVLGSPMEAIAYSDEAHPELQSLSLNEPQIVSEESTLGKRRFYPKAISASLGKLVGRQIFLREGIPKRGQADIISLTKAMQPDELYILGKKSSPITLVSKAYPAGLGAL